MDKFIYKATNKYNQKIYIGQTSNLERRINEHKRHAYKDGGSFHEDIRKYGIDAFSFRILDKIDDSEIDFAEKSYIKMYKIAFGDNQIYNNTKGGKGGLTHDVSGENNPMYGRHKTDEEKKHLSEMLSGRKFSEEHNKRISDALKGKPKSKEAVAKKSHPISVINVTTNEIIDFPSKAEAIRQLHTDERILKNGKTTNSGYRLVSEW